MLDPTIPGGGGGGGGTIRYPTPQNGMLNTRKSPMDMNTNRYEKLVQTPSRGAEGASPDCVTNEQCQSAYRQSMKTTAAEVFMKVADKAEPSRYQGTAVAAEGAGTDGTTNVRGRSIDCNTRRTTVRKLHTDCVKFTEQTSPRVSLVVAETAHTDGTRVGQYKWDYLEIPEPRLPRVFLELAEEARNVKVDSGRPCYTEEVQPQETGLTRPVFVTVMVDSPPVLKKGAVRATGVSTEMIQIMDSAGRCEPVNRSGLVGPQSKTEQPVMLGLHADQVGNAPAGPVGPDIMMDRIQPVAQGPVGQNDSDRPTDDGPVGRFIKHSPVGPDRILYTCDSDRPVADGPMDRFLKIGPVGPKRTLSLDEPNQPVADGPMDRFLKLGPVSPKRTFSLDEPNQPVADGPMDRVLKLGPVSPKRTVSLDEPNQPVADGPMDRVLKLGPVSPKRTFFLDEPNQPVAVGPVGQAFTPGPVGTHVRVTDCKRILSTS